MGNTIIWTRGEGAGRSLKRGKSEHVFMAGREREKEGDKGRGGGGSGIEREAITGSERGRENA